MGTVNLLDADGSIQCRRWLVIIGFVTRFNRGKQRQRVANDYRWFQRFPVNFGLICYKNIVEVIQHNPAV